MLEVACICHKHVCHIRISFFYNRVGISPRPAGMDYFREIFDFLGFDLIEMVIHSSLDALIQVE
jgi:hypothetical protein